MGQFDLLRGDVDDLIAGRLEGPNYTYNGKGFYGYRENLYPHPNIAR